MHRTFSRRDAAALLFVAAGAVPTLGACAGDEAPPPVGAPGEPGECATIEAVAIMSDFTAASIAAFGLNGDVTPSIQGGDLGADPVLAVSSNRYFVLARDTDRVFELDPVCGRTKAQLNVNDGDGVVSNPQDLAVAPDGALWIPRFSVPSLAIFDADGSRRSSIDLSGYDPDGNPNASAIQILDVGGRAKAFVSLGRLDDRDLFRSKQPSQILRIDVETALPESTLELRGRNPFGSLVPFAGALWATVPGAFDRVDEDLAGIERIDPTTFASLLVVKEGALGGSPTAVALSEGCGAALVADPVDTVNATSLVTFDPESGEVFMTAATSILKTDGYDLWTVAFIGDVLLVGDGRATPRYPVHAFRKTGRCDLTPLPETITLPQKPVAIHALPPKG